MENSEGDGPDGPMTDEEQRAAAGLSDEMVRKIDLVLLSNAKTQNRKVAMVVGLTMMNDAVRVKGLPDIFYVQRVRALVQKGELIAEGNLDYMRYSEVRLPKGL